MASNDPGLSQEKAALGGRPSIEGTTRLRQQSSREEGEMEVEERPTAPDQFDVRFETTKWEIWAYYA